MGDALVCCAGGDQGSLLAATSTDTDGGGAGFCGIPQGSFLATGSLGGSPVGIPQGSSDASVRTGGCGCGAVDDEEVAPTGCPKSRSRRSVEGFCDFFTVSSSCDFWRAS